MLDVFVSICLRTFNERQVPLGRVGWPQHWVSVRMLGKIAPGLITARNLLLRMRSDHEIECLESVIALSESKWLLFVIILKLPKFLLSN